MGIVVAAVSVCIATIGGSLFSSTDEDVFVPLSSTIRTDYPTYTGSTVDVSSYSSFSSASPSFRMSGGGVPRASVAKPVDSRTRLGYVSGGASNYASASSSSFGSAGGMLPGGGIAYASPSVGGRSSADRAPSPGGGIGSPAPNSMGFSLAGSRPTNVTSPLNDRLGIITGGEEEMGLYKGDAPGEITSDEHNDLDSPVINSYGQPIGDALLPMLLLLLLFGAYRYRAALKNVKLQNK